MPSEVGSVVKAEDVDDVLLELVVLVEKVEAEAVFDDEVCELLLPLAFVLLLKPGLAAVSVSSSSSSAMPFEVGDGELVASASWLFVAEGRGAMVVGDCESV